MPGALTHGLWFVCSQQRLLLIDAPLHNTFLELWTVVHFLIPGLSRPYLHLPLKAPNEENQDYYHKVVIRLHRVRAAAVHGAPVCDEVAPTPEVQGLPGVCDDVIHGEKAVGCVLSPGDAAVYPEEDQERRGEAADKEVRACSEVPPL